MARFKEGELVILDIEDFKAIGFEKNELLKISLVRPDARFPYQATTVRCVEIPDGQISLEDEEIKPAGRLANLLYK